VDVKKAIAWARAHGSEYGADPTRILLAGSSAGAHLAATAALTASDPALQPGFEDADTSATAAICLYGYYGKVAADLPSSPLDHVGPDAPPFFVVHGDRDTTAPVENARLLVDTLRSTSSNPVLYAELPGGQHTFDLFHSIRFAAVINGIEAFATSVLSHGRAGDHSDGFSESAGRSARAQPECPP
jgi:acetyl esterase/lipase